MELYQNETNKKDETKINYFITKHWAPNNDNNIEENERVYFTNENAKIIDRSMYYIHNYVKDEFKPYLLGPKFGSKSPDLIFSIVSFIFFT